MCTLTTSPAVSGGSAAGNGVCAFASSAALSGAAPAKLWPFIVEPPAAVMSSIDDAVVLVPALAPAVSSVRLHVRMLAAKMSPAATRIPPQSIAILMR